MGRRHSGVAVTGADHDEGKSLTRSGFANDLWSTLYHMARRQSGNNQQRSRNVLDSMLQDLRFALRQLRQNPVFACTTILVLALGMAASVAIFAFVDAALLRPLPYRNPSRLVVAYETTNSCRDCNLSYPDYLDWKNPNPAFTSLEAWDASVYLWRSPDGVQAVRSAHVSGGFFRTLGVTAVMGRVFTDAD